MDTTKASVAVSEARLWQRHMDMARFGATPKGGVNRQALSPEDAQRARNSRQWARRADSPLSRRDRQHVRAARRAPTAANPVMTAPSRQPADGRKYDGTYGVLAGFEVLEALEDAGIRHASADRGGGVDE